jgi:plastocyanin
MTSRFGVPGLAVATSLALVACGGGGGGGGGSPSAPSRSSGCPATVHFPGTVNERGSASSNAGVATISAGDFFFSPTCTTNVSGGTVVLRVRNGTQTLHNVSVPSLGVDQDVPPGGTISVRVEVGSRPLIFFCKYHKTSGMYGALVPA